MKWLHFVIKSYILYDIDHSVLLIMIECISKHVADVLFVLLAYQTDMY
jgi:hypothetical protein